MLQLSDFSQGAALVIGVGNYDDARWNAPIATRDAAGLAAQLTSAGSGYHPGDVETLLDAQATRTEVLRALRRLADRATPEHVALVSVTSHGALGEDGLYYLATSDARFTPPPDERIVAGSGLSVAELARALRDIPARHLLLIVNACFAGHLGDRLSQGGIASTAHGQLLPDADGNRIIASGEGRAIITAGRPEQRSYFRSDDTHSYFGQALIDALQGAPDANTAIGLYELYGAIYRRVTAVTRQRVGQAQEPVLTLLQNVGPFVVARNPRGGAGSGPITSTPPADAAVRIVPRDVIAAIGQGATAVQTEAGSTVTVDNKLIDFGSATVMGSVSIGNVAHGNIINIGGNEAPAASTATPDPLRDLPLLRARVEVARNVDEDERDNAANLLNQAHRALSQGDAAKAHQRLAQALAILQAMDNGDIRAIVRKLEALASQF